MLHPPLATDDTVKYGFYMLPPAGVLVMQEASGAAEPAKLAAKSDKSQWGSLLNQLKQKLD